MWGKKNALLGTGLNCSEFKHVATGRRSESGIHPPHPLLVRNASFWEGQGGGDAQQESCRQLGSETQTCTRALGLVSPESAGRRQWVGQGDLLQQLESHVTLHPRQSVCAQSVHCVGWALC